MVPALFILAYAMMGFLAGTISVKFFPGHDPKDDFWCVFIFWPLIAPIVILSLPVKLVNLYIDFLAKDR